MMSLSLFSLSFVFRIIAVVFVVQQAQKLGRNQLGWGIFAFFAPLIALIVAYTIKPLPGQHSKNDEVLDDQMV